MLWRTTKVLEPVRRVLGWTGGGVHKRIDENRELLELLQREAPAFLSQHHWVTGWLKSNDDFFVELAQAVPLKEGRFLSRAADPHGRFPRPWPSSSAK